MTDLTPADPAPAAPAAPPAPAGTTLATTGEVPRKSGALGVFALILGLLAFLADLGVLVFAIVQIASFAGNIQGLDLGSGLTALFGFFALAFFAFWIGIVVGALAVLLGIIAAVKKRGRVAGVFGAIFGFLVLASHIILGLIIAGSGDALSQMPGLGS